MNWFPKNKYSSEMNRNDWSDFVLCEPFWFRIEHMIKKRLIDDDFPFTFLFFTINNVIR